MNVLLGDAFRQPNSKIRSRFLFAPVAATAGNRPELQASVTLPGTVVCEKSLQIFIDTKGELPWTPASIPVCYRRRRVRIKGDLPLRSSGSISWLRGVREFDRSRTCL